MMRARLLIPTLLAAVANCASVQTTSQSLPGAAPKHYTKLLVFANTADLALKVRAESSFVRAAVDAGVEIVPAHALFLTGRAYADSVVLRTLRENNFAGVLILADATTDAPTVTASALAIPTPYGTSVTAHQNARQDVFTIVSRVVDMTDAQPIWSGSTRVERRGASDGALFDGLAKDVVQKLVESGVLGGAPTTP
jgi:hypothetical protein